MKKLLLYLAILLSSTQFVVAERSETIDLSNAYGGKTVSIDYSVKDKEYKLKKKTIYYDQNEMIRRVEGLLLVNDYNVLGVKTATENYRETGKLHFIEIQLLDEIAREKGYDKVITFYSPIGVISKREFHYINGDFDTKTYSRSIDYFSPVGTKIRTEFYLNEKEIKKTGFSKFVSYYEHGIRVKQDLYDVEGNIF